MHATNTFPVDRHPQYRHYPTTIRSIEFGRPLFASGWVQIRRPAGTPVRPAGTLVRPDGRGSDGRTVRLNVRTRATCSHVSKVARVRIVLISRPDGDPTGSIKALVRRILTLPHQKSLFWLLVSDFSRVFGFISPFLVFCALISHSRYFLAVFFSVYFFKLLEF